LYIDCQKTRNVDVNLNAAEYIVWLLGRCTKQQSFYQSFLVAAFCGELSTSVFWSLHSAADNLPEFFGRCILRQAFNRNFLVASQCSRYSMVGIPSLPSAINFRDIFN
jgi:hypothetical protein